MCTNKNSGFTVTELLVVIALIAILASVSVMGYSSWHAKYGLEKATREIYSLLMKARSDAVTTKTPYVVTIGANQVQSGPDADDDNAINGTPATLSYPNYVIHNTGNAGNAAIVFVFDRRGLVNIPGENQTINLTSTITGTNPAVDCIVISATRINLGKMTGGACVQR
jgi:prepilin-type N-terminal cleavage/methylation domain-containing protein